MIVYVPGGVLLVVVAVRFELLVPPATLTVDGLKDMIGPPEGETVPARLTGPVKPFVAFTLTVALPKLPWGTDWDAGLAETEKSAIDNFQPVSGWSSQ